MIYHLTPIVGTILYLSFPKNLHLNKNILFVLSLFHNVGLVAFSGWTFLSLLNIIKTNGIVFQKNYYFQNPEFDTIIYYFYLSKYYEFIDTFLVSMSGKTPIFLQKYHHVGAVICWHLCYYNKSDFVWMPSLLNSMVHTIMYSYYLLTSIKIQQVRIIKPYITSLQLVQFAVNYINLYFYYPPVDTITNYFIINIFAIYGIGLIYLFGIFYKKSYLEKKEHDHSPK